MPIEFGCPCGKTLRVRDDLVGERVKCPVCGEIRNVPLDSMSVFVDDAEEEEEEEAPVPEPKRSLLSRAKRKKKNDTNREEPQPTQSSQHEEQSVASTRGSSATSAASTSGAAKSKNAAVETSGSETSSSEPSISGRPVDVVFRLLVPSMFGRTVLRISGSRLIEETQRAGAFRHSEFRLDQVTGAEIQVTRNRALLISGLMTLPFGIGLIPLVAYLFVRYRLLFVYISSSNVIAVSIHALEEEAYAFVDTLLNYSVEGEISD